MDNSFLHRRPEIPTIVREHKVKVFAFPPHMTEIFQTLELSLFGMLKRKLPDKLPFSNDDLMMALIQRFFHFRSEAFVPDNVRNTVKMLGFKCDIAKSPHTLLLREGKLRGSQ
jgi:hypothetical protein